MSHLLRPCGWLCPRFGIFLLRDSSVLHEQSHKFDSAPAACPTKRCAFQDVVATMRTRAGLQSCTPKSDYFTFSSPIAPQSRGEWSGRMIQRCWRRRRLAPAGNTPDTRFDPALCCPPAATECGAKRPKVLQACGTNAHRRGASRRANAIRTISAAPPSPLKRSKSSTRGPSVGLISRGIMPRSSSDRICRASSASR
jgi:hypothetical protein